MPIEFRCTGCQQQLRVPDTSAGKNAKCPKCGAVLVVPASLGAPLPSFGPPPSGFTPPPAQPQQPPSPFSDPLKSAPGASPFSSGPAGANPFSPAGAGGYGAGGAGPNPYASPQGAAYQTPITTPGGPITNVPVSVEQIFNYAWQIWQTNLGLLVGTTFVVGVISNIVSYMMEGAEFILRENNLPEAAVGLTVLSFFVNLAVQTFLGAGQTTIVLKLIRRQPAEFSDLFGGGPIFLPLFGFNLLYLLAIFLGLILLIIPAVILALMWWPAYYLVLERRTGVFESFSVAQVITNNNWGTAFVMALLSFGIMLLGCMACIVGLLFAAPLVAVMFGTAYLMMSGQLMPYGQQPMPGQFAGQPAPGKWS
jgi:hypothetical protein